ncbi:MAG: TraX family protein [Bacillales bacterium]|nr:TraX family protein [Bacillales bacterium]
MEKNDFHFLNSFWLKIIGMITMIFDHFIASATLLGLNQFIDINVIYAFRIIGRISFILFAFLTVEGVLHSKKPLFYISRLFILSLICDLGMYLFTGIYVGNPVTTLAIGALFVYLLNQKNIYLKPLCLFPIAISILTALEIIPIKFDYDLYGLCTIAIFYFSYLIAKGTSEYIIKNYSLDHETFIKSSYYLTLRNSISCILFLTFTIIIYFVNPIWNGKGIFSEHMTTQVYSILALIPIFFYNGKRGYNKPWFKYFCYAFFPIHLILIYCILLIVV